MGELVVVEKSSIDEAFLDLTELVNAELLIKDVKIDSITTSLPTSCVVSKSPGAN